MRIVAWSLCIALSLYQQSVSAEDTDKADVTALGGLQIEREKPGSLGIELRSADNRFFLNPWLRGQFRYSSPFDEAPLRAQEFANEPGDEVEVRRARLKMEGRLFSERVGIYFEHELAGDRPLLDLRLDFDFGHELLMRIGQYKVLYNRERVDSSGKQQFAERSIATYAFTLDRQRGVTLAKHWAKGTAAANWLMLGIFEGDGRGSGPRGDQAMFVARWQWEFLGERLPFSQGDLHFRTTPAATLSFGASSVRGPYTRFSSSGGGQLDGFDQTTDDRYTLRQAVQEFAWQYAGFSMQQELHVKKIDDHETSQDSTLLGGYAQFGKAWAVQVLGKERAWELALRYARVDWDTPLPDRVQDEVSAVANLFLSGHDNKFTAEVSQVYLNEELAPQESDIRFRLQWDVSF
jgi:hypothetical protein